MTQFEDVSLVHPVLPRDFIFSDPLRNLPLFEVDKGKMCADMERENSHHLKW